VVQLLQESRAKEDAISQDQVNLQGDHWKGMITNAPVNFILQQRFDFMKHEYLYLSEHAHNACNVPQS
jgi:hypothetical protein